VVEALDSISAAFTEADANLAAALEDAQGDGR
jgi:hypothetical protein